MKRLIVYLLAIGVSIAQPPGNAADASNQLGLNYLRRSQLVDAIAAFRKAVALQPDFVRAWNNLGSVLAQAGDMEASVAAFQKAVTLDGQDPQLRMNLGIALRSKGEADAALAQFRTVLQSRAGDPEVHQQLGLTMKQQGNLEGAVGAFEAVLAIQPEHREAYYNLADVLRRQAAALGRARVTVRLEPAVESGIRSAKERLAHGDRKAARATLERLVQDAPLSVDALNLLGFVQGQDRDLATAVATLKRAVELNPQHAEARYNLGVALWYSGDRAKSVEALERAVQLNPALPEVYAFIGMAGRELGKFDEARRALQRAMALGPTLPAPYIDLGLVFLRQGQIEHAIGQFEAAVNLPSPSAPIPDLDTVILELRRALTGKNLAEGRNILGLLLGKQGADPKQVSAEFREAIRLRPAFAEAHNHLGLVSMQVGDSEQGIAQFREALRHAPEYADALGNLGAALVASQPEEAIGLLRKAVAAQPAFVRAQYNLALAYAQSPKYGVDLSMAQFRKVIELEPTFAAAHFEFGKLLFRKNQIPDAISHFQEALKLDPNLGAARYQLGLALTRAGQKVEGGKEIEQARAVIDEERKVTIAGQLMGEARAAMEAGRKDAAIGTLQQVLRLSPDYGPAREALQSLQASAAPLDDPIKVQRFEEYIRKQQYQELEPLVLEYLAVNPNSWWAHYVLGYSRFGQRRIGDSIASLAKSLELNVNNAEAHRLLGRNLMIIGRYDVARTELELAAKLKPEWAEVRYDLGKVHSANDNYAFARRELEIAVRLDPAYMEAYEALGFVMEALSEDAAALANYKKAAAINESRHARFAAPYVSLAAYYNRVGDPKLAMEHARKALEIDPKSDGSHFQLGKAFDRQQRWPEAAEALTHAIEANPRAASYRYVLSGVYRHLGKAKESQSEMEIFQRLEKEAAEFERKRREGQRAPASVSGGASPAKAPSPPLP